jgi:hypothetical protein
MRLWIAAGIQGLWGGEFIVHVVVQHIQSHQEGVQNVRLKFLVSCGRGCLPAHRRRPESVRANQSTGSSCPQPYHQGPVVATVLFNML